MLNPRLSRCNEGVRYTGAGQARAGLRPQPTLLEFRHFWIGVRLSALVDRVIDNFCHACPARSLADAIEIPMHPEIDATAIDVLQDLADRGKALRQVGTRTVGKVVDR